jgi:acetyl esterase
VWASSVFKDSRVVGRLAVKYIRAQLSEVAATIPSLLHLESAGVAPTVIAAGGVLDPTRPDARAFAARIAAAGGKVTVREYPTLLHGFGSLTHASPQARAALAEIGALAGEMLCGMPAG